MVKLLSPTLLVQGNFSMFLCQFSCAYADFTYSKSAFYSFNVHSLDYPGVGPEHSFLKDIGRAEYCSVTDDEALEGMTTLSFFGPDLIQYLLISDGM